MSEQGWSTLKAFYANARPTVEGVDAWRDVAGGATPVVISWFGGVVNNAAKNNIAMTYVDTDGGTPIVAESVGIMAGTRKIEASKAFVEWFGSPAFMAEYAAKFNQTPAHPEAIAKSPAQVQANAKLFRAQNLDWALVARNLDGWLKKVQLEIIP